MNRSASSYSPAKHQNSHQQELHREGIRQFMEYRFKLTEKQDNYTENYDNGYFMIAKFVLQ
jgi:hypothetical protein